MTQHNLPVLDLDDVADLLGGSPEPLPEAEAQLRAARGAVAHAAMLAGERARATFLAAHPNADSPEADEVAREGVTQYYREFGGWCASMTRGGSCNTLQLVGVPEWIDLTDGLRDRALQAAEIVLMAYGVTAEDADLAVADEFAGHRPDRLALRAWNAAERAACAVLGDEDEMTSLALAP